MMHGQTKIKFTCRYYLQRGPKTLHFLGLELVVKSPFSSDVQ